MRGGYYIHWNGGPSTGVFQKVLGQVEVWRDHGHEVQLAILANSEAATHWQKLADDGWQVFVASYSDRWERFRAPSMLAGQLGKQAIDVLYVRQDKWTPGLERMMRLAPSVVEVNSDDVAESFTRGVLVRAAQRLLRGRIHEAAAGAVFVTDELRNAAAFARLRKYPSRVVPNGATFSGSRVPWTGKADQVRLLFLGSAGQSWQGIDLLAPVLDERPSWQVDVVGVSSGDAGDISHPRLNFHGQMPRESYRELAASAIAGIGTLALFRKGLEESSSLKHREYAAMGLPLIIGCTDPDVPSGVSWAFHVPNRPTGLSEALPALDRFIARWAGRRVPMESVAHMSVRTREAERLSFLASIARS